MNIPANLERSLMAVSKDQWEIERERLLNNCIQYYLNKVEKNEELKTLIKERM